MRRGTYRARAMDSTEDKPHPVRGPGELGEGNFCLFTGATELTQSGVADLMLSHHSRAGAPPACLKLGSY